MARKCLVVFYSRTGTTRKVAEALAAELNCDCEEIVEPDSRRGVLGYMRSILEATQRRLVTIAAAKHDPSRYDLVAVGTPIWAWSISSPVRSYLAANAKALPQVAFFCTCGGAGDVRTFAQMQETCGKAPVGKFVLKAADVHSGKFHDALTSFAAALK